MQRRDSNASTISSSKSVADVGNGYPDSKEENEVPGVHIQAATSDDQVLFHLEIHQINDSSVATPVMTSENSSTKAHFLLKIGQDKKPAPVAHHKAQGTIGADVYFRFEEQVKDLDEELRKLGNKARALGRSAGIVAASARLRHQLGRVLYFFHHNTKELYPGEIHEHINLRRTPVKLVRRWKSMNILDGRTKTRTSEVDPYLDKPENPLHELEQFSKDVLALFDCFGQYPEFLEGPPRFSIPKHLQWAIASRENFELEYSAKAVRQYLHESMVDIGEHLETLSEEYIRAFTKIGIPTVKASQDHGINNLQNQTLVAALFAGVATGMIQVFTGDGSVNGVLHDWTVLLWYMTLIFSVASAVNGLLGLSWTQAMYRSPNERVPWWVLIWIMRFPLVFLVLAVGCFFVALILFALAPKQHEETLIISIMLSASCCFGLIVVSCWFVCELLVYNKYGGRKWLADVLWPWNGIPFLWSSSWSAGRNFLRRVAADRDVERATQPSANVVPSTSRRPGPVSGISDDIGSSWMAKQRWKEAVKRIVDEQRAQRDLAPSRPGPSRRITWQRIPAASAHGPPRLKFVVERMALTSQLRKMAIFSSHYVAEKHKAPVRSIQFSPNGQDFLTTGWDAQSFLFSINDSQPHIRRKLILTHALISSNVHQTAWSPNGKRLLMRSGRIIFLWDCDTASESLGTRTTESQKAQVAHLHRPNDPTYHGAIRHAEWLNGDQYLFVEGQRLVFSEAGLERNMTTTIWDPCLEVNFVELRRFCVTPDGQWMIGVGKYFPKDKGSEDVQYGILVGDLKNMEIVSKVQVYSEASDITMASDGKSLLVSYEKRTPIQLWQLAIDIRRGVPSVDLHRRYEVAQTTSAKFAFSHSLPGIFGGPDDKLVLRATLGGHIYAWCRDTEVLLHRIEIPPSELHGQLTSFTWRRGSDDKWMFATGMLDGTIQIWTKGEKEADVTPRTTVGESMPATAE